jgi:hypothetical protein
MTQSVVTNCPHCRSINQAFSIRGEYIHPDELRIHSVFASCNSCQSPITLTVWHTASSNWQLGHMHGNLAKHKDLRVFGIWPAMQDLKAPTNVPERVARNFVEAEEARQRKSWNAACGTYRRTMELALKEFAPDVEAWKLEKRIDKLASEHRITADMQAWAHELRLDGNEALHGDEDATEEMTAQMASLCYFLLTYLYTLPKQIEEARARRDAGANGA